MLSFSINSQKGETKLWIMKKPLRSSFQFIAGPQGENRNPLHFAHTPTIHCSQFASHAFLICFLFFWTVKGRKVSAEEPVQRWELNVKTTVSTPARFADTIKKWLLLFFPPCSAAAACLLWFCKHRWYQFIRVLIQSEQTGRERCSWACCCNGWQCHAKHIRPQLAPANWGKLKWERAFSSEDFY